jgi:hypothetical protein
MIWIVATCLLYALIAAWALYTIAWETKEYWDVRSVFFAIIWPITLSITLWVQWRHAGRQAMKAKEKEKEKKV